MNAEERFQRIENTLQATADAVRTLADSDARTKDVLHALSESELRTHQMVQNLTQSVAAYVDSASVRTARIEENLEALIRAISA